MNTSASSTFQRHQLDAIRDIDDRLAVEIERIHALPDSADLRHAIIKLESARRGLQEATKKNQ